MKKNYYKFDLNMTIMNVLCLFFFFIPFIIYVNIKKEFTLSFVGVEFVLVFIGMIAYFGIHEMFHGIGYSLFAKDKSKIKYGVVLEKGVLYAMCQEEISKKGIMVSLLFPLVFLTIIPLPIAYIFDLDILAFLAILNFAGAVGDMALFNLVLKLPKDVTYIDYDNSIGATFLSSTDLSNIKAIGLKCVEHGSASKKKIDDSIKRIYISKVSKIIGLSIIGFAGIFLLLYLLFKVF